MERVSIGGSRVVQGAGKAVKLLGKLARGLGGTPAAAEAPRPAGASAASLAGRQLSSSLGSGPLAMAAAGAAGVCVWVPSWVARPGCCRAQTTSSGIPRDGVTWGRAVQAAPGREGQAAACRGMAGWLLVRPAASADCPAPPVPHPADDEAAGAAPEVSVSGIIDLLVPPDGSVWVAHKCGTVDRYTSAGRRLGTSECGASLTAAACVGQRVWLGFSDGMIRCVCVCVWACVFGRVFWVGVLGGGPGPAGGVPWGRQPWPPALSQLQHGRLPGPASPLEEH